MIPDPDAPVFDLALLIQSNHTIISRGTYSMWAGKYSTFNYFIVKNYKIVFLSQSI